MRSGGTPFATSEATNAPALEPTYRSKSRVVKPSKTVSRAISAPTSYRPPTTPPPARTRAQRVVGPRIRLSAEYLGRDPPRLEPGIAAAGRGGRIPDVRLAG